MAPPQGTPKFVDKGMVVNLACRPMCLVDELFALSHLWKIPFSVICFLWFPLFYNIKHLKKQQINMFAWVFLIK